MRLRIALCAAGAALVAAMTGCGGSDSQGGDTAASGAKPSGTINISTWGGVWTDAEKKYFADPFTRATGVKVNYQVSGTSTMAPALLQAQSGNVKLDVVEAENAEVMRPKGLLADFPPDLMQTIQATSRPDTYKPYLLDVGSTATVIACNPAVMKRCPTTPAQFWDVKNYPGPRAITNTPYMAMAYALEADGVPRDQIYPMDIDRAIAKLKQIKPYVKVWPSSNSDQQQELIDKEVGASIIFNGRAYVVKQQNIPNLQISWGGSLVTTGDGLVVMKAAPNKNAAFAYIRWIADHPRAQAAWTKALTYPTPTKQLLKLVPANVAESLPAAHPVLHQDDRWIAQNTDKIQQAWQSFLAG